MSSPPNALDAYRSYSYHHILIAADSTTTAEELSEENQFARFEHPDVRFNPREFEGGKYIVLINGLTDTQFSIESAKWSTVPIPSVSSTTSSTVTSVQTMAVDGEITILEPQGVNFFNILSESTKLLGVDPSLITFILKTVFVGITDTGDPIMITSIKPLMFMMVDITAQIDVSGAEYTMALVGTTNGAGKMPHVNSIVSGLTFDVKSTLGETFDALQTQIKDLYDAMWQVLTKKDGNCGIKLNPDEFTQVTYEFDLDPLYRGYEAGNHKDDKFKNNTGQGGYVANLGENASIENIISSIMMTSTQVVNEAKGKLPDKRYTFKITSSAETNAQDGTFKVTYHIHKYKAVVIEAKDFQTFEPEEGLGVTFDYIFTGKNIDILDMDIKMQYGLMFFQALAAEGTSPTSSLHLLQHYNPDTFVKASGSAKVFGAGEKSDIRRPLFLGTSLKHPLFRDTSSIGASASFNSMLTRQAAVENLGIKITIRGNPQLLSDTTLYSNDLSHEAASLTPVVVPPEGDPRILDELRTIMPDIQKQPAYVKVKVWSPTSWTGSAELSDAEKAATYEGDYARNLWYDGWYYVVQIDNIFEGGEFKQTLELLSLPTELSEVEADEECFQKFQNEVLEAKKAGGQGQTAPAVNSSPERADNTVALGSGTNVPGSMAGAVDKSRENSKSITDAGKDKQVKFNKESG